MKKLKAIALTAAAGVLLAGCSQAGLGSGDDSDTKSSGKTIDLNMQYVAYAGIAPTLLGIENGTFEEHGLKVHGEVAASPAAILAGLSNGEIDVGFTTIITLISAVQQGMDVKCLASADGVGDSSAGIENNGLIVGPDSDITSASQLEGKKVGVLALGSLNHLVATDIIALDGGDPSKVDFVQLPFPQVEAALVANQVDAGIITAPFTGPLMKKGFTGLGWSEAKGNLMSERTVKCYAASGDFIKKNPELVKKFVAAQDQSLTYAQDNVGEALAMLPTVLDISAEAASETITGSIWKPGIDPENVEYIQDKMLKYGWIEKTLPVKDYMYSE